ncbi:MAG: DUF2911 domain-containing protein [Chitinophagaceae bacterium]
MRILVSSLIILLLSACDNKSGQEKTTGQETGKRDTIAITNPENNINPYVQVDVSPMDMSYYPADYPKLKMAKSTNAPPLARVIYSRPHLQGRQLFHDVLKYGEPWRLGANEATELDFYTNTRIQDKNIKAGRYILYCIPEADKWTIVLNSNIDSWGLEPDPSKDIARFVVPVKQTNNLLEFFTIVFQQAAGNAELVMAWGHVEARLPLSF